MAVIAANSRSTASTIAFVRIFAFAYKPQIRTLLRAYAYGLHADAATALLTALIAAISFFCLYMPRYFAALQAVHSPSHAVPMRPAYARFFMLFYPPNRMLASSLSSRASIKPAA